MDINLNGFLGDAILGGSYITNNVTVEYMVRKRGRRFINGGSISHSARLLQRKPFFDIKLFQFRYLNTRSYESKFIYIQYNAFKDVSIIFYRYSLAKNGLSNKLSHYNT
jgi:hypothetical protein